MEFEWNIFPGFTTLQLVQEVQKFMNKMSEPEQFQGRIIFMSMFNDIIWWIPDKEKECIANSTLVSLFAKKNSSRTLVIPRIWIRNKVVFYLQRRTTRRMGQSRWIADDQIQRKRTPSFPSHESTVSRNSQKQRRRKIIFSHNYFCQSARYLRSSLRCVWGIQYLSNKYGETRIGRAIWPNCSRQQTYW